MQTEKLTSAESMDANVIRNSGELERVTIKGKYWVKCFDKDGNLKWEDTIDNVVTTLGKNHILDNYLGGAGYSVTGPFMGLISSVSFVGAPLAADVMTSHTNWTEAGGTNAPAYSGNRPTVAFNAAAGGSKSLSSNASFTFTNSGTIKGCFIVIGAGAVNTKDNTAGTLLSAGLFASDKIVSNTDILNVSYSLSL